MEISELREKKLAQEMGNEAMRIVGMIVKNAGRFGLTPAAWAISIAGLMAAMQGMDKEEWDREAKISWDAGNEYRKEVGTHGD